MKKELRNRTDDTSPGFFRRMFTKPKKTEEYSILSTYISRSVSSAPPESEPKDIKAAAKDIAEYMITESFNAKQPISNLQLQSLLYLVQGETLKVYGVIAFQEDIQAWDCGPVVRSVYDRFHAQGADSICRTYETDSICDELRGVIDKVLEENADKSAWDLAQIIHRRSTPYKEAWVAGRPASPLAHMTEYYCEKGQEPREEQL